MKPHDNQLSSMLYCTSNGICTVQYRWKMEATDLVHPFQRVNANTCALGHESIQAQHMKKIFHTTKQRSLKRLVVCLHQQLLFADCYLANWRVIDSSITMPGNHKQSQYFDWGIIIMSWHNWRNQYLSSLFNDDQQPFTCFWYTLRLPLYHQYSCDPVSCITRLIAWMTETKTTMSGASY